MMVIKVSVIIDYELVFFFSSRRRHTRSLCDWSSDVCSSDLGLRLRCMPTWFCWYMRSKSEAGVTLWTQKPISSYSDGQSRSEERRVGKECRSRWCPQHE